MRDDDPVLAVIDALNALAVSFMLVGSYSSNLHGIPRNTEDADFVVELGDDAIAALRVRLNAGFEFDPQLGFETVTGHHRWRFRHRETGFKIELFLLVTDSFDQLRFQRRIQRPIHGRPVWFQTAEDVIINKLRWARRKDRLDVVDVMKVKRGALDWPYIRHWCGEFKRTELLDELRAEAGM